MRHSITLDRPARQQWGGGQRTTLRRLKNVTMRNIAWTRRVGVSESLVLEWRKR